MDQLGSDIYSAIARANDAIARAKCLTQSFSTRPHRQAPESSDVSGSTSSSHVEVSQNVVEDDTARPSSSSTAPSLPPQVDTLASLVHDLLTEQPALLTTQTEEQQLGVLSSVEIVGEAQGVVPRENGPTASHRLRDFLNLQLLTSQTILQQLQHQQRRADDLAARLSQLNFTGLVNRTDVELVNNNETIEEQAQHQQQEEQHDEEQQQHNDEEDASGLLRVEESQADTPIENHNDIESQSGELHTISDNQAQQQQQQQQQHPESNESAGPSGPLQLVAQRLALLQEQQSHTVQQLLSLRLEQLRLRQQQLSALQELLRAEVEAVEGTPLQARGRGADEGTLLQARGLLDSKACESVRYFSAEAPSHCHLLQLSAVQQALQLLAQSLDDMHLASAAIHAGRVMDDVTGLAVVVSRADSRAEHVSLMARQLLTVLREFPRRADPVGGRLAASEAGMTEDELALLPAAVCCKAEATIATTVELQGLLASEGIEVTDGAPAVVLGQIDLPIASNLPQSHEPAVQDVEEYCSEVIPHVEVQQLPVVPLVGEPCGICLETFLEGECVRSSDGVHYFHKNCLFEWLRIRSACPTCRKPMNRS